MIRALDNGKLVTDLDSNYQGIKNLGAFVPTPPELVDTTDPKMSNARPILDGTVTNDSVANNAAIDQTKLNFTGNIPTNYLGTTQAARGDLVELVADKGQHNGYAALGSDNKLIPGTVATSGTGTVTDLSILFPISELETIPSPSGTLRTFTGYWTAQDANKWFGNLSGATARPIFAALQMPVALIPSLDASKITSGTIALAQLPYAVGVGASHAAGLPPNPGSTLTDNTAQPTDYVGRDMNWHAMKPAAGVQPQLPMPSITVQTYFQGQANVNITQWTSGTTIFVAVDNGGFTEATKLPFLVNVGAVVESYVAKVGWNNSEIASYTIPAVPTG